MMIELLKSVVVQSSTATDGGANGPVVLTSTGDKFILTAVAPLRLLKWGFMITNVALVTGGTALVLRLDRRPTAGTDTGRVNGLDTLTVADAVNTSSPNALGTGAYRDGFTASVAGVTTPASEVPGAGIVGYTGNVIEAGQTQFTLKAGEQWIIGVTTAPTTSGQGKLFIEYVLLPISKPSGYGVTDAGTVSLTENLTRLAS